MNLINIKSRELLNLFYVLAVSLILSALSLLFQINEKLLNFFEAYTSFPIVEFVFNSAFLMLGGLLLIAYRRWLNVEKKNKKLENILKSINPDALIVIDSNRKIVMTNNSIPRLFYYSTSEVIGKTTDFLYFDRRENPDKQGEIYEILESEGFHVGIAQGKRKDGTIFPLEIITGNINADDGAVLLVRDISERVKNEKNLQRERDFNTGILQHSSDGITVFNRNGSITYLSPGMEKIFGFKIEEIPNLKILSQKILPDLSYRKKITETLLEDFKYRTFPERTIKLRNKNGQIVWCSIRISKMDDNLFVVNGHNITDRIKMETSLKESEEKYRQLVERASDGILIIQNKRIKLINHKACEIIGETESRIIERDFVSIFDEILSDQITTKINTLEDDTSSVILKYRFKNKVHREIPIEINCSKINLSSDTAILMLIRDISEREAAEENIKHRYNFERMISNISSRFLNLSAEEIDWSIDETLSLMGKSNNVDRALLFLLSKDKKSLNCTNEWSREGIEQSKSSLQNISMDPPDWIMNRLLSLETVILNDLDEIPEEYIDEKNTLISKGIKSYIAVPMVMNNDFMGCLAFDAVFSHKSWTEENERLLKIIGGIFVNAINRKWYDKALRSSEARYRSLQNNVPVGVYRTTPEGSYVMVNQAFASMFGYDSPMELLDTDVLETYADPTRREVFKSLLIANSSIVDFETQLIKKDGSFFWASISARAVYDKTTGKLIHFDGIMKDITEVKLARDEQIKTEIQYRITIDSMEDPIHLIDQNLRFIMTNKAMRNWCQKLEISPNFRGKRVFEAFSWQSEKIIKEYEMVFKTGRKLYTEEKILIGTKLLYTEVRKIPFLENGEVTKIITIIRDITEQKNAEEELRMLATVDSLTGVYNRRSGILLLEKQLQSAIRNDLPVTICYLDIDNLKGVNDNFGHLEGDFVLVTTANIFKESIREMDIILRLGGDEFLLVFPQCSVGEASKIMDRISTKIDKANYYLNKEYKIGYSHGFAEFSTDNNVPIDQLISMADAEMYKIKRKLQGNTVK